MTLCKLNILKTLRSLAKSWWTLGQATDTTTWERERESDEGDSVKTFSSFRLQQVGGGTIRHRTTEFTKSGSNDDEEFQRLSTGV